jgi:hypothetical protein
MSKPLADRCSLGALAAALRDERKLGDAVPGRTLRHLQRAVFPPATGDRGLAYDAAGR